MTTIKNLTTVERMTSHTSSVEMWKCLSCDAEFKLLAMAFEESLSEIIPDFCPCCGAKLERGKK